ncbi:MAG: hypothetical protein NZ919_01170 [Candidatus Caldarchaeum sp.]|nr:hypothetical protein [Candidatus Caldarchaeum sp.]
MRASQILGALVGIGVFVQIFLGESRLAAGAFRDVHATIGLLGLAVVLAYVYNSRRSGIMVAAASIIAAITAVQAVMGLSLYGLLPLGMSYQALAVSHRLTSYILFAGGIAVSVLAVVLRRRAAKA